MIFILGLILNIFLIIFYSITLWKIFKKGNKSGWKILVPFYNIYTLVEIARAPKNWFLFLFIPLLNIYYALLITDSLAQSFGKSTSFSCGLFFLPFIFYPILAFGSSEHYSKKWNHL